MNKRPKHLKITNAGRNLWDVKIGPHVVGEVARIAKGEETVYEFESDREDMPKKFDTRTMQEMRDQLFEKINRDTYMKVLEG